MEKSLDSAEAMQHYAAEVALTARGGQIYALSGDLGAGKTTFAQGFLGGLGAEGPFTSPTFTIVKTYNLEATSIGALQGVQTVYHIDAYRIDDDGILEIGWYDMVNDPTALILIEWPEKIESLIPDAAIRLDFHASSDFTRLIKSQTQI